jgi:outer membrane protein assembly factor BamB
MSTMHDEEEPMNSEELARLQNLDEQIDQLLHERPQAQTDRQSMLNPELLRDVSDMYQPHAQAFQRVLERVWNRLEQHSRLDPPRTFPISETSVVPERTGPLHQHAHPSSLRRPTRVETLVTTMLLIALVGGLLLGLNLAHHTAPPTTTAEPGSCPSSTESLALKDRTVYVTNDNGGLIALRADTGVPLWHAQTGSISGGKPMIANGIVAAGSDDSTGGVVYAFNAADGSALWHAPIGRAPLGPDVVDGIVYGNSATGGIPTQKIAIFALNGKDGRLLWRSPVGDQPIGDPGLVGEYVADGVVYVALLSSSPSSTQSSQFQMFAYRANDGSLLWRSPVSTPDVGTARASIVVDSETIYVYEDRVYAYRKSDGSLLWSAPGEGKPPALRDNLAVASGIVYADTFGGLNAYNASDGSLLWNAPTLITGFVQTNHAIVATSLLTAPAIVALERMTGKQLWRYAVSDQPDTLITDGSAVYITTNQGAVVALEGTTGNVRWKTQAGGGGTGFIPVVCAGALFLGTFANAIPGSSTGAWVIEAININTGKQLWQTPINSGLTSPSALNVGP